MTNLAEAWTLLVLLLLADLLLLLPVSFHLEVVGSRIGGGSGGGWSSLMMFIEKLICASLLYCFFSALICVFQSAMNNDGG